MEDDYPNPFPHCLLPYIILFSFHMPLPLGGGGVSSAFLSRSFSCLVSREVAARQSVPFIFARLVTLNHYLMLLDGFFISTFCFLPA